MIGRVRGAPPPPPAKSHNMYLGLDLSQANGPKGTLWPQYGILWCIVTPPPLLNDQQRFAA